MQICPQIDLFWALEEPVSESLAWKETQTQHEEILKKYFPPNLENERNHCYEVNIFTAPIHDRILFFLTNVQKINNLFLKSMNILVFNIYWYIKSRISAPHSKCNVTIYYFAHIRYYIEYICCQELVIHSKIQIITIKLLNSYFAIITTNFVWIIFSRYQISITFTKDTIDNSTH